MTDERRPAGAARTTRSEIIPDREDAPRDWLLADLEAENVELREELREARRMMAALVFAVARNHDLLRFAECRLDERFGEAA